MLNLVEKELLHYRDVEERFLTTGEIFEFLHQYYDGDEIQEILKIGRNSYYNYKRALEKNEDMNNYHYVNRKIFNYYTNLKSE